MKPVKQSKLYTRDAPTRGNCYAAVLASMLEVPLWMVPPFEDMESPLWHDRTDEWLKRLFGKQMVMVAHVVEKLPEFYIACGPSPRGVRHSVIYSGGKLVHDPHPSDHGITEVDYCWVIVAADDEASK